MGIVFPGLSQAGKGDFFGLQRSGHMCWGNEGVRQDRKTTPTPGGKEKLDLWTPNCVLSF